MKTVKVSNESPKARTVAIEVSHETPKARTVAIEVSKEALSKSASKHSKPQK